MTPSLHSVKSLCLVGHNGCHLVAGKAVALAWKNLGVASTDRVSLEFTGGPDFLQGLEQFHITCGCFAGPTCIQLTQAMSSVGRKVYCGGNRHGHWLSSSEAVEGQNPPCFNTLMPCMCQACLSCLHRAGKLPEGSTPPEAGPLIRYQES